ncbi:MAG: flagellar biosynthetic protein FliQ [Actinoplanes sp.]
MTDTQIVELGLQAMTIAAKMCAPVLITALLIGFAISLFQSVTQIQEATLSFVPKAAGVGAAILFSGNWMLQRKRRGADPQRTRSRSEAAIGGVGGGLAANFREVGVSAAQLPGSRA